MAPIQIEVLGLGAWGTMAELSFHNWAQLKLALAGQPSEYDATKGPKPEVIPSNERRRAPLPVRLAVESSWQATQASGIGAEQLSSVFVSGLGDTQLTDYMCKTLASERKALSPTKFHNSVHNAAAGYWTISTGCMQAANSIAAFQQSASLTLLESFVQAMMEQRPILLTFYDAPVSALLQDMLSNQAAFAFSMVVAPATAQSERVVSAKVVEQASNWPEIGGAKELLECYNTNPTAKVLALAQLLQAPSDSVIRLPLSDATSLEITKA